MELARRRAIVRLRARYGEGWKTETPADLMWMLRRGVHMEEALAMVAELTAPQPEPEPLPQPEPPAPRKRSKAKRAPAPTKRAPNRRSAPADDLTLEAKALQLLATNLDMSGAELARKLGVSAGYGRKLRARLTAQDRPEDRSAPAAPERSAKRPQDRS